MNRRIVRTLTIISDILLFNLAFLFSYVARYEYEWILETTAFAPYQAYLGQQVLLTALLIFTFSQNKVWQRRRGEFWTDELARIVYATAPAIALMVAYTFFFRPLAVSRLLLVWAFLFIVLFLGGARLLRRLALSFFYRQGRAVDRAVVIGSGEVGRGVIRTLMARPDLGYQVIGYLDDGTGENNIGLGRIPHLGTWTDLEAILQKHSQLHTAFIALPGEMHSQTLTLLRLCQQYQVRAQVVPDLLQLSLNRVEFSNMAGIPMLSVRDVKRSRLQRTLKRVLDLAVIAIGGIPALVVMLIIAIAIKLDSPGPIFYAGERIGRNGRRFKMYKFRSMVVDAEAQKADLAHLNEADGPIFKIRDDPRLTRVGQIIRRLSFDELPQLYNVLRGQMSLVGPRPPLPEEVMQYKSWHRQRLSVIGGMTGLWQVSGRSDLTFDELCLLDIYYIENWSLAMDVGILLQTGLVALFSRGAY